MGTIIVKFIDIYIRTQKNIKHTPNGYQDEEGYSHHNITCTNKRNRNERRSGEFRKCKKQRNREDDNNEDREPPN